MKTEMTATFPQKDDTTGEVKYIQKDIFSIIEERDIFTTSSGVKIIRYDGIKKLAKKTGIIVLKEPKPELSCHPLEGNRQQHIWLLCLGFKNDPENYEFSEGEASQLNTGKFEKQAAPDGTTVMKHVEAGDISAMYKSAMAYKRAYCRGVLKLLEIEGVYSEIESPDFLKASQSEIQDQSTVVDYSKI